MNDTLVLSRRPRIDRTDRALTVVGIAAFALIALLFAPVLASPTSVPQVNIANSGTWSVDVSVTGASTAGWIPLGIVGPSSTTAVTSVIDPGPIWIVQFSSGDVTYLERMNRSSVKAAHWTIHVPAQVERLIKATGADDPPGS